MKNKEIANKLFEIADFLEATKNRFRARAYRRAANVISNLKKEITSLQDDHFDLQELPYIGVGLSRLIQKILLKKVNAINFILNTKFESTKQQQPPFRLHNAKQLSLLVNHLFKCVPGIHKIYETGDLRRSKELINGLEFVALVDKYFTWKKIKEISAVSQLKLLTKTKANLVILKTIPIVLNISSSRKIGTDLLLLTGSEKHLKKLQKKFTKQDFSVPFKSEKEIYESVGFPFIEPELREDKGEIEAAKKNNLPHLVTISDIKGDLHCHTNETDGVLYLEKVVEYAMAMGYEYLAITDHTQSLRITNGLDKKRLFNQIKQIDKLNSKLKNFTILKSSECDILEDGSLDFPKEVLKELDLVVCSVHSKFRISKEKQTDRILRAIENPYCTILGHPTGRLINHRLPYEFDLEKILLAAKAHNCVLELNCQPYRLDLKDDYCMRAKALGIKLAISSDAHSLRGFQFIALGISQARRAGLEAKDVINTYYLNDMKKILRKS